jgi:WD40 repeat protein
LKAPFYPKCVSYSSSTKPGQDQTLQGHASNIIALAWKPDGSELASVGTIEGVIVRIWDTSTWLVKYTPRVGNIYKLNWSPDGSKLAFPALSGKLRVVSTSSFYDAEIRQFEGHIGGIYSVDWSPNNTDFVSASLDTTLRLWNIDSSMPIATFRGHMDGVWDAKFSPDGSRIASGGPDGKIIIWDVATQEILQTAQVGKPGETVTSLIWSPDGTQIAYGLIGENIRSDYLTVLILKR